MAFITVTHTLVNGNTVDADELNTNYDDILDGLSDGTKDLNMNAATFAGNLLVNGNTTFGSASGDDVTFVGSIASSITVKTHNSFNFGSSTSALASYYVAAGGTNTARIMAGTAASSWTFTLPTGPGTAGFGLQTNGSGTASWQPMQTDTHTVSSADYTVLDTDGYGVILFTTGNTNRTCTLPTVADNTDRKIFIKKIDSGTGYVTVDGESSETIDDATTRRLRDQHDYILVQSDGSEWHILDVGGSLYSEQLCTGDNGQGATNNRVACFTNNIFTTGQAITYTADTTSGDSWTISKDGIYAIDVVMDTAISATIGLTKNQQANNDALSAIVSNSNTSVLVASNMLSDAGRTALHTTAKLAAGDVIQLRSEDTGSFGIGDSNYNGRIRFTQITKF